MTSAANTIMMGDWTGDVKPERSKSAMQLQHNKPIERKLAKLADYYNDNSIKKTPFLPMWTKS